MSASPALSRIGQVAVNVQDLDRAVDFYRDTLGLAFLFRVPRMAFFDCGGIRLMLSLPDSAEFDHPASILYFVVDDIRAAHQALAAGGVTFRAPPASAARFDGKELFLAFFLDGEGNTLALMSEVPA